MNKIALIYFFSGYPKNEKLLNYILKSYDNSTCINLYIFSLTHFDKWYNLIINNNIKNVKIINYPLSKFILECNNIFNINLNNVDCFINKNHIKIGRDFLCSFKPFNP